MCTAILKLDRDRKLLNADVEHSSLTRSLEPERKCEQRIIPGHNTIILLKLRHESHTTIMISLSQGTLEEEDDSDCFKESGIITKNLRRTRNTDWCLCELCGPMDSQKDSLCCHSVQNLNCNLADSSMKCILHHQEWLRY